MDDEKLHSIWQGLKFVEEASSMLQDELADTITQFERKTGLTVGSIYLVENHKVRVTIKLPEFLQTESGRSV